LPVQGGAPPGVLELQGKVHADFGQEWMLELAAVFLRTETELILKSRRVVPGRLLDRGFQFEFPEWAAAAADRVRRWRNSRTSRVSRTMGDSFARVRFPR